VLAKVDEETAELRAELARPEADGGVDRDAVAGELGDLLVTLVNLSRKLGIDPDAALAGTNAKFRRRLGSVEARLAEDGRTLADAELEELDRLWEAAKS
jgi:uncharacterized protein YabN with tetrapyrrole methylase and pyrophosphatase domain